MLEPRLYAEWLHNEVFLPAVVVIGTEAAKACVRRTNGLSLAELFAPFGGYFRKISATYQGLERQMRLDGLRMRFVDAENAVQWSAAYAEQVSAAMVEASAPTRLQDAQTTLVPPSPWYEQWRLALFRALRWSEHEGLDQPVAALLVVSSKEPDPGLLLEQLLHSSNMPPLCTQGVLEPVPGRAGVLLHDGSDPESPSSSELHGKLERARARFNPHTVMIVHINRGGDEALPHAQEIFRPFAASFSAQPPPPPPADAAPAATTAQAGLGRKLSREDLDGLAQAVSEVIVKTAVPWMQQQLQQLEAQISQNRKGLRNQLKYLWRKPRESSGGTQPAGGSSAGGAGGSGASGAPAGQGAEKQAAQDTAALYPLQTTEGQMRLAGDLAFLLRDYETALGYYRNVVSDFKQDRSWKHTAGAYEMWGLCAYASGAPRSEWSRCMESAYDHYLQAAAGRHAMRAVALHQAMATDYREAAARVVKVNSDMTHTGAGAPLILEQAGQLYCQAGFIRKGTFYMVLAGHSFNKLHFKRLALNSYRSVVDRYAGKQWYHISDHFHFTMARQAFGLSLYQESMGHFMKLLNSSVEKRVSIQAERESTYVKEFLFVARNWMEHCCSDGKRRSLRLEVPCVGPRIVVLLPGDAGGAAGDLGTAAAAPLPLPGGGGPPPPPPPPPPPASAPASAPTLGPGLGPGGSAGPEERPMEVVQAMPWERLGELVLPSLNQEDRWELQWRGQHCERIFDNLRRVVAAGAEVRVELELSNPMRVRLELVAVRLGGELEPLGASGERKGAEAAEKAPAPSEASTDAGSDAPADPLAEVLEDGSEGAFPGDAANAAVSFPAQTVVLEPLETKRVQLAAVPLQEGLLRIQRVSWSLQDQVHCSRPLAVKGRRLRATLAQRASAQGVYSVDRRLELRVRRALPRLQARLEGWPMPGAEVALLAGELRACTLVVVGSSGPGMGHTVRVTTSHPSFVAFTAPEGGSASYEGEVLVVRRTGTADLRVPVSLRADQTGRHNVRFCLVAEAAAGAERGGPPSERRQWLTLEEPLAVGPSLACSARPSPSHQEAGRLIFTCLLENKSLEALEVFGVRCAASGGREPALEPCMPGSAVHRAGPGQLLQLLFALQSGGEAEAPTGSGPAAGGSGPQPAAAAARQRLLAASRAAAAAAAVSGGPIGGPVAAAAGREGRASEATGSVDLVFEWSAPGGRSGEAYALGVPRERPGAAPCPLDMHLLAQESAVLAPGLMVPVTLRVRNASTAGPVSFYFAVDAAPEFTWLGCERSEVIRLQPAASHTATLYAHFMAPGVFNLSRLRLYVVAMPPGAGAVPASEQAPLAFQLPFERLIHVRRGA